MDLGDAPSLVNHSEKDAYLEFCLLVSGFPMTAAATSLTTSWSVLVSLSGIYWAPTMRPASWRITQLYSEEQNIIPDFKEITTLTIFLEIKMSFTIEYYE